MQVDITNVGAIRQLTIPIQPGLTILTGHNGCGKSTALKSLTALATGTDPDLEVNDSANDDERGLIAGLGARFTVGRRREEATDTPSGKNRGTGQLEIKALSGLNPLDFVDPGINDPARADARRASIVCDLAQVKGGIGLFCDALGDNVKAYATRKTLDAKSIPEMASGLRRDIQAAALEVEKRVLGLDGEITAHLNASDGVDAEGSDVDVSAALTQAIRHRDALSMQADQSARARRVADESRAAIERARASYTGPTVEQAEAAIVETNAKIATLTEELRALESRIRDEQTALAGLKLQASHAADHERNMKAWSESVTAGEGAASVSEDDIRAADAEVARLQKAQSDAAVIGEKRKRRKQADALIEKRDTANAEAKGLRELATKCEDVVSNAINGAGLGLRVKNERLVVNTERGETLVADLSFGERVRLAVEIAAKSFGRENALLVVPQEAFEGLDPDNQLQLGTIAFECGVAIVAARADAGELRVEYLQPQTAVA